RPCCVDAARLSQRALPVQGDDAAQGGLLFGAVQQCGHVRLGTESAAGDGSDCLGGAQSQLLCCVDGRACAHYEGTQFDHLAIPETPDVAVERQIDGTLRVPGLDLPEGNY